MLPDQQYLQAVSLLVQVLAVSVLFFTTAKRCCLRFCHEGRKTFFGILLELAPVSNRKKVESWILRVISLLSSTVYALAINNAILFIRRNRSLSSWIFPPITSTTGSIAGYCPNWWQVATPNAGTQTTLFAGAYFLRISPPEPLLPPFFDCSVAAGSDLECVLCTFACCVSTCCRSRFEVFAD